MATRGGWRLGRRCTRKRALRVVRPAIIGHRAKESVIGRRLRHTSSADWARDLGDNVLIKVSAKEGCWSCVMQLSVKVIPLRPGTGEPTGEPRLLRCPAGVAPDTILSFLTQQLGTKHR